MSKIVSVIAIAIISLIAGAFYYRFPVDCSNERAINFIKQYMMNVLKNDPIVFLVKEEDLVVRVGDFTTLDSNYRYVSCNSRVNISVTQAAIARLPFLAKVNVNKKIDYELHKTDKGGITIEIN